MGGPSFACVLAALTQFLVPSTHALSLAYVASVTARHAYKWTPVECDPGGCVERKGRRRRCFVVSCEGAALPAGAATSWLQSLCVTRRDRVEAAA
jgi:hypothetical protein